MMNDLAKDPTQWFPMPAALVTCKGADTPPNVMGIGYVGFTCWQPPVIYLGVNTARYTGTIIKESGEFVVALPAPDSVLAMDYCGFVSGAHNDKFADAGFTIRAGERVQAPLIDECPVNLECRLLAVHPLGSHELYLGEVVETHVDEEILQGKRMLEPVILISRRYTAASRWLCEFGASAGCPPE